MDDPTFSMYPNPASENLFIESPDPVSSATLIDATGKEVLRISKLKNNLIDISGLNPGVYVVRIEFETNGMSTRRLVITR